MRTKKVTVWAMVVVFSFGLARIEAAIYFNDGELHIIDYTVNERIYIGNTSFWYEPTTVHLVSGAYVTDYISVDDTSILAVYDGLVDSYIYADDESEVLIWGGTIDYVSSGNNGHINILGGHILSNSTASVSSKFTISDGILDGELTIQTDSSLDMTGGHLDGLLYLENNAEGIISGGTFGNEIHIADSVNLTLLGSNFTIDGQPAPYGTYETIDGYRAGWIMGTLANGDSINNFLTMRFDSVLTLAPIPEPSTLFLLGLGAVMLRRKRN